MHKIEYSGINDLNPRERIILDKILKKEYYRMQRILENESTLKVHIRSIKKETRKRYILSIRLETPKKVFATKSKDTQEAGDWKLKKAVHKAIKHLKSEVEHSLRADQESWKKRGVRGFLNKIRRHRE